ncbi:helix-turn-helix domain-containing protein [Limnoglobus roseus]|uniref:DNA-binding protein n=1 Tax=Limnoglobus roseus TaxID=2598579 RepID=A0A5C1AFR4_9BACT|nr:helix-turn-helix domain-containing protein [Limnoglobus roseus]QEL17660.1 DNA-binding protein [Limnoglobus roseus]
MRLTVKQAAERAQVSRSLVYGLLRTGRLKALRIGVRGRGKWLIEVEELDAFLESCRAAGPPPAARPPLRHLR